MTDFARPRKALGQNFLTDANIINKIVDTLAVSTDDLIIEIGPGRGALTEQLLNTGCQLHLIEFDRDLIEYWQQRADTIKHLTVHGQDVLKFDFSALLPSKRTVKVIGNLPYNISSPVLFHLMQWSEHIERQVVMLQKEVVERMVANPGNKQYGRLSVMLQQRYQLELAFKVPPTAFFPPPKVESAIARLTPLGAMPYPVSCHQDFATLVKQAFSMRRKTLRNNLKGMLSAEQIESLGIDPAARAETLGVAEFAHLANHYTSLLKN